MQACAKKEFWGCKLAHVKNHKVHHVSMHGNVDTFCNLKWINRGPRPAQEMEFQGTPRQPSLHRPDTVTVVSLFCTLLTKSREL